MKTSPRASRVGRLGQPLRDRLDGAQVGRDVLAGRAVAAGRALDEAAALVAQADGEAVDLELRDVAEVRGGLGCRRQAEAPPDPRVERPQLLVAERVRERQHRPAVADLVERPGRRAADPLGRRVGRREVGERGLERDQLAEERVVVGVGQLRRVLLVVEAVGALDRLGELRVAPGGPPPAERRRGLLDQGRVDGQRGPSSATRSARGWRGWRAASCRPAPASRKATVTSSSSRVSFELTTMPVAPACDGGHGRRRETAAHRARSTAAGTMAGAGPAAGAVGARPGAAASRTAPLPRTPRASPRGHALAEIPRPAGGAPGRPLPCR